MSIDPEKILGHNAVQTAMSVCNALMNVRTKFRTTLNPDLLHNLVNVAINCPEKPDDYNLEISYPQENKLLDKICLLSGGQDSTIQWYLDGKPTGLFVDIGHAYGQKEFESIESITDNFYVVSAIQQLTYWSHIIPGRNFLLLTIAAEFLKNGGRILFGVTSGEGYMSGKGDKSRLFIDCWISWYREITGKEISVQTMVGKTKGAWLHAFREAGHDLDIIRHKTITCFREDKGQCGECQACLRKFLAFTHIGVDISEDFNVHPMKGARQFVNKYKFVLQKAMDENDFTHYSMDRCIEDLASISTAEGWLNGE